MCKVDDRNIDKTAGVCGGRAVIAGTRIRVSLIWQLYQQGLTVEEIVRHYSHLRHADVHDALAYAHDDTAKSSRTSRMMTKRPFSAITLAERRQDDAAEVLC